MTDFAVYRSGHSAVLSAWENHQKEYERWRLAWLDQVVAWGFDPAKNKPYVTDGVWGPTQLVGVNWGHSRDELPPGWKRVDSSRNRHVLEPYRSRPKGDPKIQAEFRALVKVPDIRRDLVELGMPQHMMAGLRIATYAAALVTTPAGPSTVWVKWHGVDPLASPQWWEKVSLSTYYQMVEAGKDPFAKNEPVED